MAPQADPSARALQQDIQSLPLNQVFDLIQFVLHHSRCVSSLVPEMKRVFADSRLAYTIDEGPPPTILPAVTSEEGTMLVESMQTLRHGGMEGSVSHLHKASACISLRDWAGSIRKAFTRSNLWRDGLIPEHPVWEKRSRPSNEIARCIPRSAMGSTNSMDTHQTNVASDTR